MKAPEQNQGNVVTGIAALARRISLRIRCARPANTAGMDQKNIWDRYNLGVD